VTQSHLHTVLLTALWDAGPLLSPVGGSVSQNFSSVFSPQVICAVVVGATSSDGFLVWCLRQVAELRKDERSMRIPCGLLVQPLLRHQRNPRAGLEVLQDSSSP